MLHLLTSACAVHSLYNTTDWYSFYTSATLFLSFNNIYSRNVSCAFPPIFLMSDPHAEVLVVGNKETGLKVNADKTKYVVMSRDMQDKVTV